MKNSERKGTRKIKVFCSIQKKVGEIGEANRTIYKRKISRVRFRYFLHYNSEVVVIQPKVICQPSKTSEDEEEEKKKLLLW